MKPENALTGSVVADFSVYSFEDALIALKCFPICTVRIGPGNVSRAQRVLQSTLPATTDVAVTFPRVNIVLDESYMWEEWSVEYNGKVYWSPGC